MNACNEGICFEFERKNNTTLVFLLSNCSHKYKKYFMTDPLNRIFNNFDI